MKRQVVETDGDSQVPLLMVTGSTFHVLMATFTVSVLINGLIEKFLNVKVIASLLEMEILNSKHL
jgi:hypothetical protein